MAWLGEIQIRQLVEDLDGRPAWYWSSCPQAWIYNSRILLAQKKYQDIKIGVPERIGTRSGAPFIPFYFPIISTPFKIQLWPPKNLAKELHKEKIYLKRRIYACKWTNSAIIRKRLIYLHTQLCRSSDTIKISLPKIKGLLLGRRKMFEKIKEYTQSEMACPKIRLYTKGWTLYCLQLKSLQLLMEGYGKILCM